MFRTSQIRCKVKKFITKFTSRFVNKAPDWLLSQTSQSNAQLTNRFVDFHYELLIFATFLRSSEHFSEIDILVEIVDNNTRLTAIFMWNALIFFQPLHGRGQTGGGHPGGLCHGCEADCDVIDGPVVLKCPRCERIFASNERRAFEEHIDKCTT